MAAGALSQLLGSSTRGGTRVGRVLRAGIICCSICLLNAHVYASSSQYLARLAESGWRDWVDPTLPPTHQGGCALFLHVAAPLKCPAGGHLDGY